MRKDNVEEGIDRYIIIMPCYSNCYTNCCNSYCSLLVILAQPNLSVIAGLLDKYNLTGAVLALQNGTVYLPTNAAFAAIASIIATLTDEEIVQILLYHVSGQQVPAGAQGNTVLCSLNNLPLLARLTIVNNVKICSSCTTAQNTVVNIIPEVLIPFNPICLLQ